MNVMTERLLQFIWQFQYFNKSHLETSSGERILIQSQGQYNTNQGPDFTDARIRISNTTWVGNVELHVRSSDWKRHGHQLDPNYSNVILHVVWENDTPFSGIPVLELGSRIPKLLLGQYRDWMESTSFIPCGKAIATLPAIHLQAMKERLLAERLLRKAEYVCSLLQQNNHHWEETSWWLLARAFGGPVNAEAFESIARSIPLALLHRHKPQLYQLEALLLGQAGLLEEVPARQYPLQLQQEYFFLRHKYSLKPSALKPVFLRMRPSGFPGLRLAQLAMFVHHTVHLFNRIVEAQSEAQLKEWCDVSASEYWHYHYRFEDDSSYRIKRLGSSAVDHLIINAAAPLLFAYGSYFNLHGYTEKAVQWLERVDPEQNPITRGFTALGIGSCSAFDTQALLELKKNYCDERRCLDCAAGHHILQKSKN